MGKARRLLAMLLTASMVATLAPVSTLAADSSAVEAELLDEEVDAPEDLL